MLAVLWGPLSGSPLAIRKAGVVAFYFVSLVTWAAASSCHGSVSLPARRPGDQPPGQRSAGSSLDLGGRWAQSRLLGSCLHRQVSRGRMQGEEQLEQSSKADSVSVLVPRFA